MTDNLCTAAVVSMNNCEWCDKAVTLLTGKGYDIVFLNVGDKHVRDFMKSGGFKTVPQIFIGGKLIGGYDQLAQYFGD